MANRSTTINWLAAWIGSLGLCCLAVANAEQSRQPIVVKISEFRPYLPEDHPVYLGMKMFADQLSNSPTGIFEAVVSPPIADRPDQIARNLLEDSDSTGSIDMVVLPVLTLKGITPDLAKLTAPYAADTYTDMDTILEGGEGSRLLGQLSDAGIHGLSFWENGFLVMTSSRPLETGRDFHGLRFRVMPDADYARGFELLGASIVRLPFQKAFDGIRAGEIDAHDSYLSQIATTGIEQFHREITLTRHAYSVMVLCVSKADWAALTSEQRATIESAARIAAQTQRRLSRLAELRVQEEWRQRGVNVRESSTTLDHDLKKALRGLDVR